ncbi:MAG: DUF6569 family protein [bacterium]
MSGLLRTISVAGVVAVFVASTTLGAYLDSDYSGIDSSRPDPRPEVIRPIPLPRPFPESRNPVTDLIRRVEVGSPYRYAGLTVFPLLVSRAVSREDIRSLDEALRNDWIIIREKDNAQVSELHVRNESRHMVFLMAGEIVAGGRQNRVIREDVLLPARSGFVEVPVYCLEQERWEGKAQTFSSPESMAHQGLRQSAVAGDSQDIIWKEAAAKAESVGVSSKTRNYQEIYESRDVRSRIDNAVSRFDRFVRRDTIGAVAVVGDQIISCDIFSDPGLFSRLWTKLCRSYALEDISAVDGDARRWRNYSTSLSARDVERFLSDALRADYDYRSTPGGGRAVRIGGAVNGAAIIWDSEAVHAAMFPGFRSSPRPVPIPMPGMRAPLIE